MRTSGVLDHRVATFANPLSQTHFRKPGSQDSEKKPCSKTLLETPLIKNNNLGNNLDKLL